MHERHDIDDATAAASSQDATVTLPVVQEEIDVDTRVVESGRVTIRTRLSERQEDVLLLRRYEQMVIDRVAVNRPVDAPVAVREVGDVMIIPVHEEITVVTRQLVLKEELHVRRATFDTQRIEPVTLRRQDVEVERSPAAAGATHPP